MVLEKLQLKVKEIDTRIKAWVSRQSAPVEVAVVTIGSGMQGAVIGALMGSLTADVAANVPAPPGGLTAEADAAMRQMQALSGGPWMQARNFAVMTGVNAGITSAMKRVRGGVEDLQTSMTAAFGSGVAFSFVSGVAGGNRVTNAITTGLMFAAVQGGLFQLGKNFSKPGVEDVEYYRTKVMLSQLGLQKYEKNFKKGLLNDSTIPLLNDSALQEVKIPPGPRLLILNHISRLQQKPV
eukprot:TRINITY_DN373_c0_g1_i1.p1 TRINITY_DN373_c0_g1~~TRINITY_DN373_c0_g1_i1.p1  ORF type:complete len:238 (-),score=58.54 TRINITY_DN373_c0_g1_i1:192-905(-)